MFAVTVSITDKK